MPTIRIVDDYDISVLCMMHPIEGYFYSLFIRFYTFNRNIKSVVESMWIIEYWSLNILVE